MNLKNRKLSTLLVALIIISIILLFLRFVPVSTNQNTAYCSKGQNFHIILGQTSAYEKTKSYDYSEINSLMGACAPNFTPQSNKLFIL